MSKLFRVLWRPGDFFFHKLLDFRVGDKIGVVAYILEVFRIFRRHFGAPGRSRANSLRHRSESHSWQFNCLRKKRLPGDDYIRCIQSVKAGLKTRRTARWDVSIPSLTGRADLRVYEETLHHSIYTLEILNSPFSED